MRAANSAVGIRSRLLAYPVAPQVAWSTWVLFLSVITACVFLSPRQGVYPIFANAGRGWCQGLDLYEKQPPLDQFFYAPGVAVFFGPWTVLPDRVGGVLWRLA